MYEYLHCSVCLANEHPAATCLHKDGICIRCIHLPKGD